MHRLPTWYYTTENFWIGKDPVARALLSVGLMDCIGYPHWDMPGQLKCYYLLQSAYWIELFLVLVLKLEKPRSDFTELCIHHVVTLWPIG